MFSCFAILNHAAYGYDRYCMVLYRTVQQSYSRYYSCSPHNITKHITAEIYSYYTVCRDITRFCHVILQIELHRRGCDITCLITGHITHIRQFILHVILHDVLHFTSHYISTHVTHSAQCGVNITHNKNYTKASYYSTYFKPYFSLYYSHVLPVLLDQFLA